MSDAGVSSWPERIGIAEKVLALLAAVGALGAKVYHARRKRRQRDEQERDHYRRVLFATARVVQLLLEESMARDAMTSTSRIRPMTPEQLAESRGAYMARKKSAADDLARALGQDEDRPQDMFAEGDQE